MKGGIQMPLKKSKKKVLDFDPEDYVEDEEEEEDEDEEEMEEPEKEPEEEPKKQKTKPKVTVQDVLLNHEQRIQAIESWAFRIKSQ